LSGNNLLIVMLLISLLVVGVSGIVVKSLFGAISRDLKVLDAKNKADKQLTANLEAAPKLVASYQGLGATATALTDALPNTADFPGLISLLENMASDAGLTLKSISPTPVTGDVAVEAGSTGAPQPQPYSFSIAFDATYDAMLHFLGNLESSARPMRITGLQVNGSGSALSGTLDVQTFYQDKAQLPFSKETIK
jgi:Tfp pilus assembly protein PilO